jgi:hypothetical protein
MVAQFAADCLLPACRFSAGITAMTSSRNIALAAGVLSALTFVSSPTLALYGPIHDPNHIVGNRPDSGVIFGGIQSPKKELFTSK